MKQQKKRNKKYVEKSDDYISPIERQFGKIYQMVSQINLIFTYEHIHVSSVNNIMLTVWLWTWIYEDLADIDASEVREFLEGEFIKAKNGQEVFVWDKEVQEAIIELVTTCHKLISRISSRVKFAKLFNNAVINAKFRVSKYIKPELKDAILFSDIIDTGLSCIKRIEKENIKKMHQKGYKVFMKNSGEITYVK